MDITLRKAQTGDVEDLAALLAELFAIEADFEVDTAKQVTGLRLLIDSDQDCVMVAESAGRVIAMCSVQTFISTAEGGRVGVLEDMVVARGFTGKGVGRRLLSAMEHWAATRGLTRLQLLADRDNGPALAFYARLGWSPTRLVCLRKTPSI